MRNNEYHFKVYESPPTHQGPVSDNSRRNTTLVYKWWGSASKTLGYLGHVPDFSQLHLVVATCLGWLVDVVRALLRRVEASPLYNAGNRKRPPRGGGGLS